MNVNLIRKLFAGIQVENQRIVFGYLADLKTKFHLSMPHQVTIDGYKYIATTGKFKSSYEGNEMDVPIAFYVPDINRSKTPFIKITPINEETLLVPNKYVDENGDVNYAPLVQGNIEEISYVDILTPVITYLVGNCPIKPKPMREIPYKSIEDSLYELNNRYYYTETAEYLLIKDLNKSLEEMEEALKLENEILNKRIQQISSAPKPEIELSPDFEELANKYAEIACYDVALHELEKSYIIPYYVPESGAKQPDILTQTITADIRDSLNVKGIGAEEYFNAVGLINYNKFMDFLKSVK